jgi:hypothetical protein
VCVCIICVCSVIQVEREENSNATLVYVKLPVCVWLPSACALSRSPPTLVLNCLSPFLVRSRARAFSLSPSLPVSLSLVLSFSCTLTRVRSLYLTDLMDYQDHVRNLPIVCPSACVHMKTHQKKPIQKERLSQDPRGEKKEKLDFDKEEAQNELATEKTQNAFIQAQDEDLTQDEDAPSLKISGPRSSLALVGEFAEGVLGLELGDRTIQLGDRMLWSDSEADSRDGKFSETGSRDDESPTLQRETIIHATEPASLGRGGSARTHKVRDKPGWCWREANDGALLQKLLQQRVSERESLAKIDTLSDFLSRQACVPSSEEIYRKLVRPASLTPFASRPSTAEGTHGRSSSSPDNNPDMILPVSSTFLRSRPSTAEGLRPPSRIAVDGESIVTDKGDVRSLLAADLVANNLGANEAGEKCRVAPCLSTDMLLVPRPAKSSSWIPPTIRRKRRCEQKRINGKPQPNMLPSYLQRTNLDADLNPQHAIHGQGDRWVSEQLSKEIDGRLGSMMMSNQMSLFVTTLPPSPSSFVSLSGSFARSHRQPSGDERDFGGAGRGGRTCG